VVVYPHIAHWLWIGRPHDRLQCQHLGVRLDLRRLPPALTSLKEADARQPAALVLLFHKESEPFSAALVKTVACAANFFAHDIHFAAIGDVRGMTKSTMSCAQ